MLNNSYVTPDAVRTATASFVDNAAYFTDGDDRPAYFAAWQPRLGLSYDLTGQGRTVLFGGFGRYFDRVLYNSTLDERFRLQYAMRTFQFSSNGGIRDGVQTIVWNPAYLSVDGLNQIIASGSAPNPEVFLIANGTTPPVSDQWSIGVRHSFGSFVDVGDVCRQPGTEPVHLHPRQPPTRRHLLPDRARVLGDPHLGSRGAKGVV